MKTKQSSDDVMKTPVLTIILHVDFTSIKPKVKETVLTNRTVILHKPRLNIMNLSIDNNPIDKIPPYIEVNDATNIEYTINEKICDDTLIDLNAIAFTPKHCYNLITDIIDVAPKRALLNAEALGFSTWGSISITHWETLVPKQRYFIIKGTYNIHSHNNYIIAWKNKAWLNKVIQVLDQITETQLNEILNNIFDKIVIVEGYVENSVPGMIVSSTHSNLGKLIISSLTANVKDPKVKIHLERYLENLIETKHVENKNMFKALEVLQGEKVIMDIIIQTLNPCNDITCEHLIRTLVQRLSLNEDLIHKLFTKNRKTSISVKCSSNTCTIKNKGDVAIVDLIALDPKTNSIVLHVKTLMLEDTLLELKHPGIENMIIRYRLY